MNESDDKVKQHFIRGIIAKDGNIYAPLIQVVKFCRRFPNMNSKTIGDVIENAMNTLQSNTEVCSKVPEVKEVPQADGGINDGSTKKT